ncbi:MAG: glutamine synthetase, partial [Muribaculaceae bacterium]|nr:glutamine synthetase [Muribaculaceae bacterium]
HQEAPTNVCWGDRNRSVLVRVPLGWTTDKDMAKTINAYNTEDTDSTVDATLKQTVEIRSADGSADIYLLIAGLAVACRYGFELNDALDIAHRTYVDVNIHQAENSAIIKQLDSLPVDCGSSADALENVRHVFEAEGVFTPRMIDTIISRLKSFDPEDTRMAMENPEYMGKMVRRYFHCG